MITLTSRKQVKICVYWKDEKCTTFAEYWIGGKHKADRPIYMVKRFMSFVLKYEWISFGEAFKHLTWWEYYKGKREDEKNGNELQPKIPDDSS